MSALLPYAAVFRARFRLMLQYRAAALAGVVTQAWWGGLKVMVLAAFYAARGEQPIALDQAITYTWLGQGFFTLLPWNADPDIARLVRSGDVGHERLRPLDTYALWFARALAWRLAAPALRALPLFLLAALVLPLAGEGAWALRPPAGAAAGALFLVSMGLVGLLSAAITTLASAIVLATGSARGINTLLAPLVVGLSGMIVPLPLLPDWLQPLLLAQPFAGLVDIPYRIYFGQLSGGGAFIGLARQALWALLLVLAGRRLLASAFARLQVQGG